MIPAHAHADAATEVLRSFNPLPRLRPKPVTQTKRIDVHQFQFQRRSKLHWFTAHITY